MNPTVDAQIIEDAFDADPAVAWSEYGRDGEVRFRSDVETFVSREVVEAAVVPGRVESPPVKGVRYFAFVDPAGGSGRDSMTLAIAHVEGERVVLDLVREVRPPFSPEDTAQALAQTIAAYTDRVTGDRYGGEWPREQFRKHGLRYELSERVKSDIYREFLPLLNSGRVDLLEHSRLVSQFCGLERRTARGGRDSIDHAPGPSSHDDVANSAAGAVVLAATTKAKARPRMPAPVSVGPKRNAWAIYSGQKTQGHIGLLDAA